MHEALKPVLKHRIQEDLQWILLTQLCPFPLWVSRWALSDAYVRRPSSGASKFSRVFRTTSECRFTFIYLSVTFCSKVGSLFSGGVLSPFLCLFRFFFCFLESPPASPAASLAGWNLAASAAYSAAARWTAAFLAASFSCSAYTNQGSVRM